MNDSMIELWNLSIDKDDTVYHLGDFAFTNIAGTRKILETLHGKKYLFKGSHDKSAVKCKDMFEKIYISELINVNDQFLFLAHHCHRVWPRSHYNVPHLFGHSHGGLNQYAESAGKLLDVGVDSHGFMPWSFDEVMKVMDSRPDNFNFIGNR